MTVILAIVSAIGVIIGFIRSKLAKPEPAAEATPAPQVRTEPQPAPQARAEPQAQPAPQAKPSAPAVEPEVVTPSVKPVAREQAPPAAPEVVSPAVKETPAAEPAAVTTHEPQAPIVEKPAPEVVEKQVSPASAADDILQTSQASIDDLDIISAPIRHTKATSSAKPGSPAGMHKERAKAKQPGRRRRGIRLRDTSTDSEDGLN